MSVGHELMKWRELRGQLEDVEGMDELCLLDTLEGATNLKEILLDIDDEIQERESHVEALAARIEVLTARRDRHKKAIERLRTIILQAMDSAGIPKIEGPAGTLSVSNVAPALEIEDETKIPVRFWIRPDPKIDRKALAKALKEEPVEGARLGNGGITLTIRRK